MKSSRFLALTCAVLLAAAQSEAGILGSLGERAEKFGRRINEGAGNTIEAFANVLGREEGRPQPVPEATSTSTEATGAAVDAPDVGDEVPPGGGRARIDGTPYCKPGEVYMAGECRPTKV